MRKKDDGSQKPMLLGAVDLVHLNHSQRMSLLGHGNWLKRRDFLKKLLGAGAFIVMPGTIAGLTGCGGGTSAGDTCSCQADTGCASHTGSTQKSYPIITGYTGSEVGGTVIYYDRIDTTCYFYIYFSKTMDVESVYNAISILYNGSVINITIIPNRDYWNDFYKAHIFEFYVDGLSLPATNGTLTLRVAGTAKDIEGNFLDGNNDGKGKDDFNMDYDVCKYNPSCTCESDPSCPCQSNCLCQSNNCSCQSNSCSCNSNTCQACNCQYVSCPSMM